MNNKRIPLAGHAYHKKSDAELHYIVKDAGEAARAMKGHNAQAEAKYLDQVNDASTVLHYRKKLSVSEANSLKREQPMPSIFDDPFNSVSAFHESFKVPVDENHLKPGTKLKNGDEELTVEKPVGKDKYVVKEENLDEVNHREFASHKVMHPSMAKFMKPGNEMDFYDHGTGDKKSGKVLSNNGKSVSILHAGKTKIFKIKNSLDEESIDEAAGHTMEAHGVKGMKNTPWRKTFKSHEHAYEWAEKNDADIHGTRDLEQAKRGNLSPAMKESIDESPSPFNWKAYTDAKKEGQLRNHTTSKSSSGGTVYKKKEELEDEPKGGEGESGEKKRGRPAGWTGEYKKRSAETVAASRAKRAATLAAKKAANSPIKTEEFFAEILEDFSSSEIMDFLLDEEVLSLDELSKATLGSYIKKANRSATGLATNAMHLKNTADTHRDLSHEFPSKEGRKEHAKKSDEYSKYSFDATQKQIKRTKGIEKATDKLMKEGVEGLTVEEFDELLESFESLDELSKQTLSSYVKKASNRLGLHKFMQGKSDDHDMTELRKRLAKKKSEGISKAATKLAKEEVESIYENVNSDFKDGDLIDLNYHHAGGTVKHGTTKVKKATNAFVFVDHPTVPNSLLKFHQTTNNTNSSKEIGTVPGSKIGGHKITKKKMNEEVESIAKQIGSLGMSTIIGSALDTNK